MLLIETMISAVILGMLIAYIIKIYLSDKKDEEC